MVDVGPSEQVAQELFGALQAAQAWCPHQAVRSLYQRFGTWRAVAEVLGGYSASYWCHVAHGMQPSRRAENLLRRYFGLAPRDVERLFDMRADDLAWYVAHRRPTDYAGLLGSNVPSLSRGDVGG